MPSASIFSLTEHHLLKSYMAAHFELFTSLRYDPILLQVKDVDSLDVGWNSKQSSLFYMLDYHRDRMLRAAAHWEWTKAVAAIEGPEGLARLETFLLDRLQLLFPNAEKTADPMRVKVLLSQEGELKLESSIVPKTELPNLFPTQLPAPEEVGDAVGLQRAPLGQLKVRPLYDVYVDEDSTPRSEYTHFKTTWRGMYDEARNRAGLKPTDTTKEVLVVDHTTGLVMEGSLTTPYFWRRGRWVTPTVSRHFSQEDGSGGQDGTTRRWALERGLAVEEDVKASTVSDGECVWLSNGVRGFVYGIVKRT